MQLVANEKTQPDRIEAAVNVLIRKLNTWEKEQRHFDKEEGERWKEEEERRKVEEEKRGDRNLWRNVIFVFSIFGYGYWYYKLWSLITRAEEVCDKIDTIEKADGGKVKEEVGERLRAGEGVDDVRKVGC